VDHFVHRKSVFWYPQYVYSPTDALTCCYCSLNIIGHTHRVTRGTLLVCGRPDGRLSKLSTAEASVCLSVNQASSIQSWGGTCESITIGHNPFKLPLSHKGIFLKRKRPLFLCERMLVENDAKDEKEKLASEFSSTRSEFTEESHTSIFGCIVGIFAVCFGCFARCFNSCYHTVVSRKSTGLDSSFFSKYRL
jgi:hypothetical protein